MLLVFIAVIVLSFGFVVLRGAPYVPTHRKQLARAFDELYQLSAQDVVVDLGSGDGIVLQEVAKRGAGGIGYELNPLLVLLSKFRLRHAKNIRVELKDYSTMTQLPTGVTVVYAFTTGHSIESIGRLVEGWSVGRELYFISYGFTLETIKPLKQVGPMSLYRFKA